jgi:hypothetical protein
MRSGFRIAALLLTAFLTSDTSLIAPLQAKGVTKVSERELRQLFPGQFHAIAHGLLKVSITALADGTLFPQQVGKSDTGIWNIHSGQLCIKFSKWIKGRIKRLNGSSKNLPRESEARSDDGRALPPRSSFNFDYYLAGHRIGDTEPASQILKRVAEQIEDAAHLRPRCNNLLKRIPLANKAILTFPGLD